MLNGFKSIQQLSFRVARNSKLHMSSIATKTSIFNPTKEHLQLRQMLRQFVETEVDPQALEFNRAERFNVDLFRKLGALGLLGVTVPTEYGGSGFDATSAVIIHGKPKETSICNLCFIHAFVAHRTIYHHHWHDNNELKPQSNDCHQSDSFHAHFYSC